MPLGTKKYFFELKSYQFGFVYSLITLVLYNKIFLEKVWAVYPSVLFVSLMFAVLLLLMNVCCALLFWKYTVKPLAVLFTLVNAFVFYFMYVYHAAIDRVMLLNVLETDMGEAKALLSWGMLWVVLLMGVLPSYLICKTKIVDSGFKTEVLRKLAVAAGALIVSAAIIGAGYKETAQFLRNNKPVKYYLIPVNYIGAIVSVTKIKLREGPKELVKIAEDAKLTPYWKENGKKNLFVFVVGETARAANFSLNGYDKPTNEPLTEYGAELLSFANVSSCGTSTAISLPCMFSKDGRRDFEKSTSEYTENLTDVAQRAGYKVWWRGNVTGCKGLCTRVENEILCKRETCYDEILLTDFKERVRREDRDMFVILHQLGSHGPTYYKRYPKTAEKFVPNCGTERLDKCSREEIMNVYDNTIYYTSENLAAVIADLKALGDEYNTMMLYVSDHGESLGENNIYLHAAPYAIAPDEQIKVPLVLWFSDEFAEKFRLDRECLQAETGKEFSHDNIFHSFLGVMGIKSSVYNQDLDIFAKCRKL